MNEIPRNAEISVILGRIQDGDESASDELFEAINDQLRKLASGLMRSERNDHTLQATGLVNEAYLKMVSQGVVNTVDNRRYLFAAAVQSMQQILIDHARRRKSLKRGGNREREALDVILDDFEAKHSIEFEEMHEALAKLKQHSERQHQVLTLRFFSGLTIAETAEIMNCSRSTIESDWRWARAKLHAWLSQ